jgi:hypothetical protein
MLRFIMTVRGWRLLRCTVCNAVMQHGPRVPDDSPCLECERKAAREAAEEGDRG